MQCSREPDRRYADIADFLRILCVIWWGTIAAERLIMRPSIQRACIMCHHPGGGLIKINKSQLYPYALRTRKSAGLMTRKLSVTESQKTAQFFGTSTRRKCRTDRQKSL